MTARPTEEEFHCSFVIVHLSFVIAENPLNVHRALTDWSPGNDK
jgi:hypothetical protein